MANWHAAECPMAPFDPTALVVTYTTTVRCMCGEFRMAEITQETAQKIDFLIQGVEDGTFDDVAKKIEFVKKLGGDFDAPAYLQELLRRIDTLEEEKHDMKSTISSLTESAAKHRNELDSLTSDMHNIAKAIQYLLKPDPLANELYDVEQFVSKYGARKY